MNVVPLESASMKAKCIALQHKVPKEHAASSSDNTQKLVHWSPELVTESTFTSSPHKPRSNPYFSSSSSFSQPPPTFMGQYFFFYFVILFFLCMRVDAYFRFVCDQRRW